VLVGGSVAADAVGALKKTPATATATAEAARRARKGTPPFEAEQVQGGLYTSFNRSVARMGLPRTRWVAGCDSLIRPLVDGGPPQRSA
jgi:hypothetical protein